MWWWGDIVRVRGAQRLRRCVVSMHWQALEIDDQFKNAWNGLGVVGGGAVRGSQYSAKQCCEQVCEEDWLRQEVEW